jgi:hypothetical protein
MGRVIPAVVRILDKNPSTGEPNLRTAAVMRKGTSFGVRHLFWLVLILYG